MNIHADGNLSHPFDENQTIGVRKSGLKHSLQQSTDGGFPSKSKGLGGSAMKKQRRALGDVTESQINSRQKSASSSQSSSKLTVSVTKPSSKLGAPKVFVEKDFSIPVDDMTCTGQSSQKKDLYDGVERMAAKKAANSKPGLFYPSKNGLRRSTSSRSDFSVDAAAILRECSDDSNNLSTSGSFLTDIFDDQSINDLLNDD